MKVAQQVARHFRGQLDDRGHLSSGAKAANNLSTYPQPSTLTVNHSKWPS